MTTFAAREAKRQFGRLLDTSQREPVTIEKHGRPVAVVISKHDFDRMQEQLDEAAGWKETEHLLSTASNRRRLLEAIEALDNGKRITKTMEEIASEGE